MKRKMDEWLARSARIKAKRQKGGQKPFDFRKCGQRHVALKVAYFGWDMHGLASQANTDNTVEGHVFEALQRLCLIESRETAHYSRCGRTDKGVSALSQVLSLRLRSNLPPQHPHCIPGALYTAATAHQKQGGKEVSLVDWRDDTHELPYAHLLNKVLPPTIRVRAWAPVSPQFMARWDCTYRKYKYWFMAQNRDISKMQRAAAAFHGTHSFLQFHRHDADRPPPNYRRRMFEAKIVPINETPADPFYQIYEFHIAGQAFLWHQVRCMMGILLLIGEGREEESLVPYLLKAGSWTEEEARKEGKIIQEKWALAPYDMASDAGLCLVECGYEGLRWIEDLHGLTKLHASTMALTEETLIRYQHLRELLQEINQSYIAAPDADETVRHQLFKDWKGRQTFQTICEPDPGALHPPPEVALSVLPVNKQDALATTKKRRGKAYTPLLQRIWQGGPEVDHDLRLQRSIDHREAYQKRKAEKSNEDLMEEEE